MEKEYTILCCTDFSENAKAAFLQAVTIASFHPGAVICLLNVLKDVDAQFWNSYLAQAEQDNTALAHSDVMKRIDSEYRPLVPDGVQLRPEIRAGQPAEQILAVANELPADIIIIGRQGSGYSRLKTFFFGDVSLKVGAQAKCPVLLVPMK